MTRSSWDSQPENGIENDTGTVEVNRDNKDDDAFELLDHRSALVSIANDWEASTSTLPPKTLPLRSTTHVVRKIFWTGVLALIVLILLGFLLWLIPSFLPDTDRSKLQTAFAINLRGPAHLTFTEAKAIDVAWQLFIGAGGRLCLAWVSYKVFMDGLARITEQTPVSYSLYASLTFSATSLWTTYNAVGGLFSSKGWRLKFFLLWFALSTLYVLGFPTLMSATAGYVSPSTFGFKMTDGNFVTPDSADLKTCINLPEGALIGYKNGTILPGPPVSVYDPVSGGGFNGKYDADIEKDYPDFFSVQKASSNYTKIYNATKSPDPPDCEFDRYSKGLSSCDLNYTLVYTISGRNYTLNYPFQYFENYYYKNTSVPAPDLEERKDCLSQSYFVWGFSSLLVYINVSLFMVWIFGMYIVWADANIYSALCRSGRKLRGNFRAAADLSEAMKEVLGEETCAYSDRELWRELRMEPGMRYYASDPSEGDVSHIGLSSRKRGRVPYNSTKLYGKLGKER
ncbi:hypothetical protein ACLMJK_004532 [Lecanora helva]